MRLLHELVADCAAAFPMKPAAADAHGEMTYGQLETRSASLAAALAFRGFHAGDTAAVFVPYAKEILLGAVSILRAGGIFVPLDDSFPAQRLEFMLNDCEVKAILTVRELWERQRLNFPEDRVFFMDEAQEQTVVCSHSVSLDEASPAMLLYTSGTTGQPKGILHTHGFLIHIADWMAVHTGAEMNADTRSGVISDFPFVGSQMFLLGPLSKGGTVFIAPEAARKDLESLDRFLHQTRITHVFLPSGLAAFMAEDYDMSGIFVFSAGDKLRAFQPHSPGNCLINSYGSTETGGLFSKMIWGNESVITVGRPHADMKAMLADEALQPVPREEAGELLVSGPYMARKYFHLPELSAEKWVKIDGECWFRTGDRARLAPDGSYEILGRMDNMIKLRGFRIETGEVEAQISAAASAIGMGIGHCVVAKKTIGGTDHLCCYYEAEQELDSRAMSVEIAKTLTEYMVPDIWVRMDALPRNANGKILRSELPQPELTRKTFGTLDNEIVARLVWTSAEVLKISGWISPDDSFTALGGTSLTAMELASRLREQGIRVTAAQILQLDSLRRISEAADVIYEQLWTAKESETVRKIFAERDEHIQKVLPLTACQDEMLFDQILHPDRSIYRDTVFLQLDSLVDPALLREALDILSAENEELRSSIVFHGVTVVQQVITDRKIPLEIITPESFGSRDMNELRKRVLHAPMDLPFSSLMQVVAVYAGKETHLGFMTHRIAIDTAKRRTYLARIMRLLESSYPADASIRGWRELLEEPLLPEHPSRKTAERKEPAPLRKSAPPEIFVYSENSGPKLVFIHTGNTGSEAYYRLADRIREQVSFAVIEPFNLYHPDQARYGIDRIAEGYIDILKRHQPKGPYLLGGWCYGGVVAHEMACQLQKAGEEVRLLFLLDAHALGDEKLVSLSRSMHEDVNLEYFETCPLFADLRASGMLDAMVTNAAHVSEDLLAHVPSFFNGPTVYFKPQQIPIGTSGESREYWETMMDFQAGNYENYCDADQLRVVSTPHEHDLMMDDPSLDIIVPEILKSILPHAAD